MPYIPEAKSDAFRALPGAAVLIELFAERPQTYLVGGAVRDLMLGFIQFDFDLMVAEDAAGAAALLAERIPGSVREHPRFMTANFCADDGSLVVDIATSRRERYAEPGALPEVSPASPEEDLPRRDFTVNAMAMAIWAERFGELIEFPDASSDLMARILRVTHDASFIDDPTRLLRLLRYGARLGFTAEPHTEELARNAVAEGVINTVSGARIRDELIDLLSERSAVVAIESMHELGLDGALHAEFHADEYLAARAQLELQPPAQQALVLLALGAKEMGRDTLQTWLGHLALPRAAAKVVREAVEHGATLLDQLDELADDAARSSRVSSLHPETLVFALALPGSARHPHAAFVRSHLHPAAAVAD